MKRLRDEIGGETVVDRTAEYGGAEFEGLSQIWRDEEATCVAQVRFDPMDDDPELMGELASGIEYWEELAPDTEELFMLADRFEGIPIVQEREFWGPERDPVVPDAVKGSVIYNKVKEFVEYHTVIGNHIVSMDVLNWTRGQPMENMNLLFTEIHQQVAQNPERRFILVIRRTDRNTIRLLMSDPLVRSCSTIFNVSPCDSDGALISGDDVLDIQAWKLMGAGFSPLESNVTHASVGADDYILLWMRHYFGIQIIIRKKGDQYRDGNILAAMFRGIPFAIEVIDGSTGTYKVFQTTLENN